MKNEGVSIYNSQDKSFWGLLLTGGGSYNANIKIVNLIYILVSSIFFFYFIVAFKQESDCKNLKQFSEIMLYTFSVFVILSSALLFLAAIIFLCKSGFCDNLITKLFNIGFTILYIAKSFSVLFFTISILIIYISSDFACKGVLKNILLAYCLIHISLFILWIIMIINSYK